MYSISSHHLAQSTWEHWAHSIGTNEISKTAASSARVIVTLEDCQFCVYDNKVLSDNPFLGVVKILWFGNTLAFFIFFDKISCLIIFTLALWWIPFSCFYLTWNSHFSFITLLHGCPEMTNVLCFIGMLVLLVWIIYVRMLQKAKYVIYQHR